MVIARHDYGRKSVLTSEVCEKVDYQHHTTKRKRKKLCDSQLFWPMALAALT